MAIITVFQDTEGKDIDVEIVPEEIQTFTYEEDLKFLNYFFDCLPDKMKKIFLTKKERELDNESERCLY